MGMTGTTKSAWPYKSITHTITENLSNTQAIANDLLTTLSTFKVAFAYKIRDWDTNPTTNNDCVALIGGGGNFYQAVRYRNSSYANAAITASYDGIAKSGEQYIILYID